jgi:hypothetical protein
MNLCHIGRITLPRGIGARGMATLNRLSLRSTKISQEDAQEDDEKKVKDRLDAIIGDLTNTMTSTGILIYRKVPEHKDDWEKVFYKNHRVAPAFLHVVLKGRCDIRVGKNKASFKRGDVFLMDPNVLHEVTSSSLCVTYVSAMPMAATLKIVAKN